MKREHIFTLFFLAFLGFILFQVYKVFTPFLGTIFWAFVLTFAFFPLHEKFEKVIKNKILSSLLTTIIILAVVIIPTIYLILYLSREAVDLYVSVKNFVSTGQWQSFILKIRQTQLAQWVESQAPQWSFLTGEGLTDMILAASKNIGNFLATNLASFTKNLVLFFLHFLLLICLIFLFFLNGRVIYQYLYDLIPMPAGNKASIFSTLNSTLTALIRGQFLTGVFQGALAGIVFYFLGIKIFIFLGVLTFIASMIPLLGASSVWIPIVIYFLVTGSFLKGFLLFILGAFGISMLDNFLKPLLISGPSKMSVFLIFLSILGGIYAYGISGIFIGPIVMAIFFALVHIFQEQYISDNSPKV